MSDSHLTPLVNINQHNIALLFSQYLRSQGIASKVEEQQQEFVVWCDVEHLERARHLFAQFIENPHDDKYQQAAWDSSESVSVKPLKSGNIASFRQQFLAHAGWVTLSIFALCWLVYIVSVFGFAESIFFKLRFFSPLSVEQLFAEPLRLIGPAFFHFSLLHIAFNTMWWWQLGGAIEQRIGKWELIQLFLISAICSNLGQYLASGPNFGGLSGVVYAVVGYVWWAGWLAPEKGLSISKPVIGFLMVWLLLGYAQLLPINMANTAHSVGLISGCILAWIRFKR
ncbi:rhomboid family intramembrane serine protease GlpG [Thalassotalea marina]|uniref:Rhomboid family intramembrane serine protease GlpG n=1 Tax=Thalassotalea marina TaxID=1673741 RepID=A0A919BN90_9GAMM|nr:rhomboid family intramembrane serine protease GlpG [Thalassotalea marina]GHF99814.1 rhomboid family intramembrane serine protease GlpG [Thalassotalea marina]